jgi:NADH pyrophosphatase NudC (nudix superfamily)
MSSENLAEKKEFAKCGIAAAAVIKKDGKYLLVQEKAKHCYGLWNWPAGRVDVGETIEEGAVREAKEESGFDVKLIRKLDIFQNDVNDSARHAFEAEIIGGELYVDTEELLDVKWFTLDEILAIKNKLRSDWVLGSIEIIEGKKL